MKTGVSTTECGRVISATLALVVEHFASTRNAKAEPSPAPIVTLGVKVKRPDAQGLFADQNSGFGSCPSMLPILDQEELEHLGLDVPAKFWAVRLSCSTSPAAATKDM